MMLRAMAKQDGAVLGQARHCRHRVAAHVYAWSRMAGRERQSTARFGHARLRMAGASPHAVETPRMVRHGRLGAAQLRVVTQGTATQAGKATCCYARRGVAAYRTQGQEPRKRASSVSPLMHRLCINMHGYS
jgi:hypothetical protein